LIILRVEKFASTLHMHSVMYAAKTVDTRHALTDIRKKRKRMQKV